MSAPKQLDAQKQKKEWADRRRSARVLGGGDPANLPTQEGGVQHRCIISQKIKTVNPGSDWGIFGASAPALLAKQPTRRGNWLTSAVSGALQKGWMGASVASASVGLCSGASAASEGVAELARESFSWLLEGLLSLGVVVCFFGCLYGSCRLLWWAALLLEEKGKGVVGGLGVAGSCPNCGHPISPGVIKVTPGGEKEELGDTSECEVRFNVKVGSPKGRAEGRL